MKAQLILLAVLLVGIVAALALMMPPRKPRRTSEDRCAEASLRTVASAQADFRANDRDGNGREDFWRGDVAGLYALRSPDGNPIKLIYIGMAGADHSPKTDLSPYASKKPHCGYWYRALRHGDEAALDPNRFAVCAFPDVHSSRTRLTFILDERNTVFMKDLGRGGGIDLFPADPLQEGWKTDDGGP